MGNLDPTTLGILAAGVLILLGLVGLLLRKARPPQGEDEPEAFEPTDEEPSIEEATEPSREESPKESSKAPKTWKTGLFKKATPGCDHHYEVKGFPADKLGTHYILVCDKCGNRMEVEIGTERQFLRQRDDVRDALAKAKSGQTKRNEPQP